jgi:hypothetical protein
MHDQYTLMTPYNTQYYRLNFVQKKQVKIMANNIVRKGTVTYFKK